MQPFYCMLIALMLLFNANPILSVKVRLLSSQDPRQPSPSPEAEEQQSDTAYNWAARLRDHRSYTTQWQSAKQSTRPKAQKRRYNRAPRK